MKQITELIDAWAEENFGQIRHKFFGYSELITRKEQVMPVTIPKRNQVSLDSNFDLITWMRLANNITGAESEELSFGRKKRILKVADIRLMVAHTVKNLPEEFILDFDSKLPDKLVHPDYKLIFIDENRVIDADHETIYRTELGNTEYEKHRLTWNIYAIPLRVEFIYCK